MTFRRPRSRLVPAVVAGLLAATLAGCAMVPGAWEWDHPAFDSTWRRVLARAERGDAESQNAAGYMLYHGEGVAADRVLAQLWFERSADQGNARARRNLAYVRAFPPGAPGEAKSLAPAHASVASRGQLLYETFCSGCHGVNGIAAYENSPSFAFGERLDKSDAQLLRSLMNGMQEMPGWEGKLPDHELHAILAFVRTFPARFDRGVVELPRASPGLMYLFGPMEARRNALAP
jgi:mono/diheme cytochrome c family protein